VGLLTVDTHVPFFLLEPVAHLHLHSFPTRRSSDLPAEEVSGHEDGDHEHQGRQDDFTMHFCSHTPGSMADSAVEPTCMVKSSWRSEEHTSELQSHLNLVCRLLLEKKNKNQTNTTIA